MTLVVFGITGLGRVLLALGFVTYVPGRAILTNWSAARERSDVALPIVLSIALLTVPAVIALWVHAWEPLLLFYVVAIASIGALGAALFRRAGATAAARRQRSQRAV